MTLYRRVTKVAAVTAFAIVACCAGLYAAGARINTTKSIPIGLYWVTDAPATVGAYVMFCPPKLQVFDEALHREYITAGLCPQGGYSYMMKKIVAAANDRVQVSGDGVTVNGALLPLSAPRAVDKWQRPMPRYQAAEYVLGNLEVLLMSDVSATSFDGRYFGPLQRSQIVAVIRPVWLFD